MLKFIIAGRRRGGMTVAQLHRYMTDVHGAAVVGFIASHPYLTPQRYVQNHVFDGSFRVPGASADPLSLGRDFVTQVWFDSPAQAQASLQAPFRLEQLRPDEDRFVDQTSVVKMPVRVRDVMGADKPASKIKVFVFHRLAAGMAPDELANASAQLWQAWCTGSTPTVQRLERNQVLAAPGESCPVDLIDEAWVADEDAAHRVAAHWLEGALPSALGRLLEPGAGFALLARERVMFAGAG